MSTQDKTVVDQATHDSAVAAATTSGRAEGSKDERTRISAIINSDAGKARPKAALSAALRTDMSAEQATAFLADLPEESAPVVAVVPKTEDEAAPGGEDSPFAGAMDINNPKVGAGAPKTGGENAEDDGSDVVALARSVGLHGVRPASTPAR